MTKTKAQSNSWGSLVVTAAFMVFASMTAFGQSPSPSPSPSPPPPERDTKEAHAPITERDVDRPETNRNQPAPINYFFPDVAPGLTEYSNKYFAVRLGFAVLADYTVIGQDSTSRAQVGPQASKFDLRAARYGLAGQLKFKRPWTFFIGRDFNEHREDEDRLFDGLDYHLTIPLWRKARITIGKQKETFIYEMVGDAANLPQQERILNPFFTSRNIGIKYQDNFLNDRMSFSAGVFNDWFQSGLSWAKSGTQVSGRLTGLVIDSNGGRKFLHLGVAFRHLGADDGKLRYKARPESNITDNYVDTGNFPARYARQLAFEGLYSIGPFSVLTEFVQAWVRSPEKADPTFKGFYVTGSYVLTGENRPYDKKVGYARRIMPESRWGAVELVGRFGYLDLDHTLVKGGKLQTWYAGANWWASRQWKVGLGYGLADLDKLGTTGRTQRFFSRVQWIY